ncbi:hypothetical protein Tco_1419175 [Tanacetum coccineum]
MLLEGQKWAGYKKNLATFESKIAMLEDEKSRLEEVETWLRQEVVDAKHDRAEVVSKVVLYIAMALVHNDDMAKLVGRIMTSASSTEYVLL